jgi:hypothetical protein
MDNTEVIFFLHSLRETKYFKSLEKETFQSAYVSNLYWLVKDFYQKYGELPIDPEDPNLDQISEVLRVEKKYYLINPDISEEKNRDVFLSNCATIFGNNYHRYSRKALDENMSAWIDWENFQESYAKASEYMKTIDVTPNNVRDVINKARDIMNNFSLADSNEQLAKDYFDPAFHEESSEDIPSRTTGLENFDLLCNSKGDGVKEGNLVVLVGAPNIGKTIILGNLAASIAMSGSNCLFISCEMDERDMRERLSGRIFNMKMDEYESRRKDMKQVISEWEDTLRLNEEKRGELLLKRMYSPTHVDINRAVRLEEKERGIKIHFVVLDYLTEMGNAYGIRPDNAFNTYNYHKTNTGGLFDDAGAGKYRVITAHQSSNIDSESTDMFLEDLSESKGILHAPDTVIGIIQSSSQKSEKRYFLKGLKTRHSKYKGHFIMYEIDYSRMYLKERAMYSPEEYSYDGVVANKIDSMGDIGSLN